VIADWLGSVQNLRWIRFYFTNVGGVTDYVELGAVFAGTYLEPPNSIEPGLVIVPIDPSPQRVAIGGQRSSVVRPKYHKVSGQFRLQTATAADNLRTAFWTIGTSQPFILAVDPTKASRVFYGRFVDELATNHNATSADLWSVPVNFLEDVQ
jgi:hypothetical protein